MTRVIARFCECGRWHKRNCPLQIRLVIKERICRERGIVSYVPDSVEEEIDRAVAREIEMRSKS